MGPKEAPMIWKTMIALPASPVIASAMLTAVPMPTETNGLTLGNVALKLLAAINAEKHAAGNAEITSRNNMTPALRCRRIVIKSGVWRIRLGVPGGVAWAAVAVAAATAS